MAYIWIGAGAIAGANLRFGVSQLAVRRFGTDFPWGTFLINVTGSFLIGLTLALVIDQFHDDSTARQLIITGFLGGYTTFSTFTWESNALIRDGKFRPALGNILGSVVLGLGFCLVGIWIGTRIAAGF